MPESGKRKPGRGIASLPPVERFSPTVQTPSRERTFGDFV